MHGSLFNDTNVVAKDSLTLNNNCLISQNITLHYSQSLEICECLIGQIY